MVGQNIGRTALNNAEKAVALNQKDVNTALRDAQEEASKAIQSWPNKEILKRENV